MKNLAITKDVQDMLTPKSVLQDLLDGNQRFIDGKSQVVDNNALINQTIGGQFPKAVVLSCIDSRVPVETVLDQAIGDIFVSRVAGNFENIDILGSLEYSCKAAGSKLVLVLGHESCGAVKAACDGVQLGNITAMLGNIMPAVELSKLEVPGESNSTNNEFVAKTVENNVKLTIERIKDKSDILRDMENSGEIAIVGGVYSLSTGRIQLI
ncbi:carbonic anhydrase family protein [Flavobacteriaceae bacterium]|jgi:carbonic anhydrase|nr:carbonic anhydrase family protein [Flavobacteriaceae bacterium]